MDDYNERRCRCEPYRCCCCKPCLQLQTATVIIASFELIWNLFGVSASGWLVLFYESDIQRAVKGGFASKQDIQLSIFMEANGDGLKMLCTSYAIATVMAFVLLIHADKVVKYEFSIKKSLWFSHPLSIISGEYYYVERKRLFMVWWLLVMPNVTGLQIAAIYFFPFPYTHANSAVVLLRIYFFWTVFSYVKELGKYPNGVPKPPARAETGVDDEAEAGEKGRSSPAPDFQNHFEYVGSHLNEGDNFASTSISALPQHDHLKTRLPSDYTDNPSLAEYHHKHNDTHEHHIHPSRSHPHQHMHQESAATYSKNHERTDEHFHHQSN